MWIDGFGFWYYLSMYALFELVYTSIMVPYETLATEMTTDFAVRSKLTGAKAMFGKVANFLAAFIPAQLFLVYSKDQHPLPADRHHLCVDHVRRHGGAVFHVWERPVHEVVQERAGSLGRR